MKSPDTYIDEVYEKYDETKKNNQKYKTVKMRPKHTISSVCGVALCMMLAISITINMGKENDVSTNPAINYVGNECVKVEEQVYSDYLHSDTWFDDDMVELLMNESDLVLIATQEASFNTIYEQDNDKLILMTKKLLNVNSVLKGKTEGNKELFAYKYGGNVPLNTLIEDDKIDWDSIEKIYIGYELTEEEIENGIFRQTSKKGIEFEDGKQYLVFLSYDDEEECYKIFDATYGIMEYDPVTNKVKNIETGEFEDFDWDLIKNS